MLSRKTIILNFLFSRGEPDLFKKREALDGQLIEESEPLPGQLIEEHELQQAGQLGQQQQRRQQQQQQSVHNKANVCLVVCTTIKTTLSM